MNAVPPRGPQGADGPGAGSQPPGPPVDPPPPDLPPPEVRRRHGLRLSLIWLVPLAAAIAAGTLAVRTAVQRGPEITIAFRTAEGIEAGRTEVRYKEVVVGRVERVRLGPKGENVEVDVNLIRSGAGLAVDDTKFWVVRPRIGTSGVSGLSTLISGAYIGVDAGESATERTDFTGLEAPPLVLRNEPGRSFVLRTADLGSLDIGSPVYHRRVRVGRVVGYALDDDGAAVEVRVFVEAPHDRLVVEGSRFWSSSGLDFTLDARGLKLDTQSLVSLVGGGIAFVNPEQAPQAKPAAEGRMFTLFDDQAAALAPPDGTPVRVRMRFAQSARGLSVGAPVDFLGVRIGEVRAVTLRHEPGRDRFPVEVEADVYPDRLGIPPETDAGMKNGTGHAREPFVRTLVSRGLIAQMRTGNLLSGQLYVSLDLVDDPKRLASIARAPARTAALDAAVEVPTVASPFNDLQPQIARIVSRIADVPFDRIGRDLQSTLAAANTAISQLTPEARDALRDVRTTLEDVQRNLADDSAPLQRNANRTLEDLQRAARSLRALTDYLQRHPESLIRGVREEDAPPATRSSTPGSETRARPEKPGR